MVKCGNAPFWRYHGLIVKELIFGKGMRTATFEFSESGGSLNGPDLFTELPFPVEILAKPLIH